VRHWRAVYALGSPKFFTHHIKGERGKNMVVKVERRSSIATFAAFSLSLFKVE